MLTYLKRRLETYPARLAFILGLFLALAVLYSVVVPIGRGADEWAHYWYARFIAEHGRLPASPAERDAAGYKSDWPPLYHLFAAGLTAGIDTAGPPTFKYRADNIRRQMVPAQGPEAILHTQDELFPWRQEILIWHLGRFLSIGFSLGTLVVTYFIAVEIFSESQAAAGRPGSGPDARLLGLLAAAALAFIPRFLFTGMLFSYDSLTLLLASLFLWQLVRIVKGNDNPWSFWSLGALAGLALVTKYLAALLPLEILVAAFSGRRSGRVWHKLGQAGLAWLLVTGWWFGYLLLNFNEIDRYGPVLGSVAPLLRGDGSDRTVEQIFAWISGGQAPPPAHIDQQSYTAWQILAELPVTFWGNPVTRPYPLSWFVIVMTGLAIVAGLGLIRLWRRRPAGRRWIGLLLLHSMLPLPFMIVRLFGARDALEAVQGRHLLFLAGPALVILLVWGLSVVRQNAGTRNTGGLLERNLPLGRFAFYLLIPLLLAGAVGQLVWMRTAYAPPLPVQTTPYRAELSASVPVDISLPGAARLIDFKVAAPDERVLHVSLIWQAGAGPAPEDYRTELALVDGQGRRHSGWLAYQTQARYPTRAWEKGDVIRDEGWLPLVGLPAGTYTLQLRLLGETDEVIPWQTLVAYPLAEPVPWPWDGGSSWLLWQQGRIARRPPTLSERTTAQLSLAEPYLEPALFGPDGLARPPASSGEHWASFIVGPDWPAGDYRTRPGGKVVLRVAENERLFQAPAIAHPLEVNFEHQLKLLGYELPARRVQQGQGLPLTVYWQGLQWMDENFVLFTRLLTQPDDGGRQEAWGGYDRLAQENYSTLFWAPGQVIPDGFAVPVAAETPDGVYTLSLGWYREVDGEAHSLHLVDPQTGELMAATSISLGSVKIGGPPPGVTVGEISPDSKTDVSLGTEVRLLGFDLGAECPGLAGGCRPGETQPALAATIQDLTLTLYWQALAAPDRDYTVFVHLRRPQGEIVAQQDGPPAGGAYPTGLWETGETIRDEVRLRLNETGLSPGRYELVVGMYDLATGERLPVEGSPDSTILLQTLSFEPVE